MGRRVTAMILAVLLLAALAPPRAAAADSRSYSRVFGDSGGAIRDTAERSAQHSLTVTAKGIDVSHNQGTIDWETVKDNVDFVIIRCGYGINETRYDDTQWKRNADACTRLGIPFGVYLYSYAETDDEARSEAAHALRLLSGYKPSLPVYLDLEDEKYIAPNCTNAQILSHATIFCEAMEAAGYRAGVYANRYWWTTKLTSSDYDRWDRWVAVYGPTDSPGYNKSYSCWQYSKTGSVGGISGYVDLDYWYGELPTASCEHSFVLSSATAAGCTADGKQLYTCSKCGETKTQTIAALGHDYGAWIVVTPATCVSDGVQRCVCSRCSAQKETPIKASGVHTWDDGEIIAAATCTTDGKIRYTCRQCGEEQTDIIPCSGHSYTNGKCSVCGAADPGLLLGDLNGDGAVSSADAVLLSRALAGLVDLTAVQRAAADLNGDGAVSSADIVLLARRLVGTT